jgi:hypothetical protein
VLNVLKMLAFGLNIQGLRRVRDYMPVVNTCNLPATSQQLYYRVCVTTCLRVSAIISLCQLARVRIKQQLQSWGAKQG